MNKKKRDKQKVGPKPDTVKLDGDWQDAINEVLKKKKPKEGWPEPEKAKKEKDSGD